MTTTQRPDEGFDLVNVLGQRLRERRRELGLTLAEVAAAADISVGHSSAIEKGNTLPSLSVLARLAHALQLTLAEVLRASPGPRIAHGRIASTPGTSDARGRRVANPDRLRVAAGRRSGGAPFPLAGDDVFVFVNDGAIEIHESDDHHVLATGDSVHFHAPRAIAWSAASPGGAGTVWVTRAPGPASGWPARGTGRSPQAACARRRVHDARGPGGGSSQSEESSGYRAVAGAAERGPDRGNPTRLSIRAPASGAVRERLPSARCQAKTCA